MRNAVLTLVAVGILVGTAAIAVFVTPSEPVHIAEPTNIEVTAEKTAAVGVVEVHRSESCSCCGGHVDHLRDAGFDVVDVVHEGNDPVTEVKNLHGIPTSLWSCHTTLVGDYAVEGHVPADVILELVDAAPATDGVSLAGMPAGSPGMGGEKSETWQFTMFNEGTVADVLTER